MQVVKRDGRLVDYEESKIKRAIKNAMLETKLGVDEVLISKLVSKLTKEFKVLEHPLYIENIQDTIEMALMQSNRKDVAKRYILYRSERGTKRPKEKAVHTYKFLKDDFLNEYKHREEPFKQEVGKFVYYRTYSRPLPELGRRERWWETVARVVDYNIGLQVSAMKRAGKQVTFNILSELEMEAMEIYDLMYNLKLFPSGRSLWVAGTPASYDNALSNFNCSFMAVDEFKKFSELIFILMLGVGGGLSVESKHVNKLPKVNTNIEILHKPYNKVKKQDRLEYTEIVQKKSNIIEIVIGDSKFGWHKAVEYYFDIITSKQYASNIEFILFNYDNVRPSGERLLTFGGFASGHTALSVMFDKINKIFTPTEEGQKWKKLSPLNCLDIATSIAENVVSGGTRRSALIIFGDPTDEEVLNAKSNVYIQTSDGQWKANKEIEHRTLSNNTILREIKPSREELSKQMDLVRISGEPGLGNLAELRRRRPDGEGTNPCGEILLRSRGVCNLTEVNVFAFVRPDGTLDEEGLLRAQELSAKIGYRMATIELELPEWDIVNKEDMLTGTSLTGVMDAFNVIQYSTEDIKLLLNKLRETSINASNKLADYLGLNRPKLATTVKPSGTISQLPTVSSGMHYSHSPYYIRRVRVGAKDTIVKAMSAMGFEYIEESMSKVVFEFPVKAPEGKTKYDVGAIEQLEMYKLFMENYVTHNASNTIHVRPHEWEEVEEWVYNNWDSIVGVTFLSLDDSFYPLLPYEAITKEKYEEMLAKTPKFDYNILTQNENFDEEDDDLGADCDQGFCPIR